MDAEQTTHDQPHSWDPRTHQGKLTGQRWRWPGGGVVHVCRDAVKPNTESPEILALSDSAKTIIDNAETGHDACRPCRAIVDDSV
ncbi:hypothetical protein EW146_g3084 [Bondarzewia mesenterica]|uniref:Uncharacterized protein n=1 Tax=Bondarzewia mesenterica TaxID=1095465 RepID=A0A4S4M4L1_9AGAM|nr:hypothetical protein EW146_g3084 [Bondarzewia mesenterica]